jgi:hypothetical protein
VTMDIVPFSAINVIILGQDNVPPVTILIDIHRVNRTKVRKVS